MMLNMQPALLDRGLGLGVGGWGGSVRFESVEGWLVRRPL